MRVHMSTVTVKPQRHVITRSKRTVSPCTVIYKIMLSLMDEYEYLYGDQLELQIAIDDLILLPQIPQRFVQEYNSYDTMFKRAFCALEAYLNFLCKDDYRLVDPDVVASYAQVFDGLGTRLAHLFISLQHYIPRSFDEDDVILSWVVEDDANDETLF